MKLLAIDAATEACSVALLIEEAIFTRHRIAPRGHAQHMLNMVSEVTAEAGISLKALDAIAFDRGPGSFTGVRVGASVTQGLAFGADLPVIPISSLASIAQGVWRDTGQTQILAVIDARMGEVYWGHYTLQEGVMCVQGAEHVSKASAIRPALSGNWFGAGTGWQAYQADLLNAVQGECSGLDSVRLPHALDILTLARPRYAAGEIVPAEQALPTYLRNEVAIKQTGV